MTSTSVVPDPQAYELIVVLGSVESVANPELPFLASEREFIRDAATSGVPVLGICFGAQLLANALEASVRPADAPEVGWYALRTLAPDLVTPGPWFQWHVDCFDVPKGGELLAEGNGMAQAFRLGSNVGLQFHPEVTTDIVTRWAEQGEAQLRLLDVDVDRLLQQSQRENGRLRQRAFDLFDRLDVVLFPTKL